MRFVKPDVGEALPYSVIKIQGCTDQAVGFTLLREEPTIARRRYCNKVLVHECAGVEVAEPLDLERVEFIATSDPCYKVFEFFKTTQDDPDTLELERDSDDLVTHITVLFSGDETNCIPLSFAYRMYGYMTDTEEKIMLSQGRLLVVPCGISNGCEKTLWTDVNW